MDEFLDLVETLEARMDQIRTVLGGEDWFKFSAQLKNLAPDFGAVRDETDLARAIDDLYEVCEEWGPVSVILRGSAAGQDRAPNAQPASQQDIQGIANRFLVVVRNPETTADRSQGKDQEPQTTAGKSQGTIGR